VRPTRLDPETRNRGSGCDPDQIVINAVTVKAPVPRHRAAADRMPRGHSLSNGNGTGKVSKVAMPSVAFSVLGNWTVAVGPSRVTLIDPVPWPEAVLALNKVTTYSSMPAAFWVTPAVGSRALVPLIVRLNLATAPLSGNKALGSPRLAVLLDSFASKKGHSGCQVLRRHHDASRIHALGVLAFRNRNRCERSELPSGRRDGFALGFPSEIPKT